MDQNFLFLSGLGSFFSKRAWASHKIVRGFLIESLAWAAIVGRPRLSYRTEESILRKLAALRIRHPECFPGKYLIIH